MRQLGKVQKSKLSLDLFLLISLPFLYKDSSTSTLELEHLCFFLNVSSFQGFNKTTLKLFLRCFLFGVFFRKHLVLTADDGWGQFCSTQRHGRSSGSTSGAKNGGHVRNQLTERNDYTHERWHSNTFGVAKTLVHSG